MAAPVKASCWWVRFMLCKVWLTPEQGNHLKFSPSQICR
jgi:hypothetical protein